MESIRQLEIRRLRTELAFLVGDTRHGGPSREDEISQLREQIEALLSEGKEEE